MGVKLNLGILGAIDDAIIKRSSEEKHRDYLGASLLGEECPKKLWYTFHQPKPVRDAKLQRIFDRGHLMEDYVAKLLRDAGCNLITADENGEQYGFVDREVAGHCDGVILSGLPESSAPHLWENKAVGDKSFNEFVKNGIEKTNYKYYVQVHIYMHKLKLKDCLFTVINCNTCEIYTERIKLNEEIATRYIERGVEIARSKEPMGRAFPKKNFFKCKFCDYNEECWAGVDE